MVHRIYDTPVESFGNEENQFLPLLYVVLALGCLFNLEGKNPPTYKSGIDHGCVIFPLTFSIISLLLDNIPISVRFEFVLAADFA
jgi:hypothetical protein